MVNSVVKGGPTWNAGVAPGDELIALDEDRVPPEGLRRLVGLHRPGDELSLLVARRGRLRDLTVTLGEKLKSFRIAIDLNAGAAAERQRALWLGGGGELEDLPVADPKAADLGDGGEKSLP